MQYYQSHLKLSLAAFLPIIEPNSLSNFEEFLDFSDVEGIDDEDAVSITVEDATTSDDDDDDEDDDGVDDFT